MNANTLGGACLRSSGINAFGAGSYSTNKNEKGSALPTPSLLPRFGEVHCFFFWAARFAFSYAWCSSIVTLQSLSVSIASKLFNMRGNPFA